MDHTYGEGLLPNEITPELAEVCGIHAGDGYLRNDGEHVELDISGHINEDRFYYNEHVAPLFSKLFGLKLSPRAFPSRRTYGFVIRKRKIVRYFHEFLDFPYGAKTHTVMAPQVIIKSRDKEVYAGFLRGLFDTDGCLNFRKSFGGTYKNMTFKRTHRTYPRILLSTTSENLAIGARKMLDFLGIHNRIVTYTPSMKNETVRFRVLVRGKRELQKWMVTIGSKNPVQITRYDLWKKFGFYLPNTTVDERIQMLKCA